MLTFIACIALIDLGIGFYVGTYWILPLALVPSPQQEHQQEAVRPDQPIVNPPLLPQQSPSEATTESQDDTTGQAPQADNGLKEHRTLTSAKNGWQASASTARTDIATIHDRIRYALTANDKQLAKEIAADIRTRIQRWQKEIQDLLALLTTDAEQDSTASNEIVMPELCLAQIETVQTNLALLDWSESADLILEKLQRQLESINKLLPVT